MSSTSTTTDRYVCDWCGAQVEVPHGSLPRHWRNVLVTHGKHQHESDACRECWTKGVRLGGGVTT